MNPSSFYDQLERLSAVFRTETRRELGEENLLPVQLEMLHYLASCNRFSNTPVALTEYLGQTKGTVSQTLNLLETKGFLVKVDDPEDKRVAHLCLTKKGKTLIAEKLPTQLFKRMTESLTNEELEQIDQAIKLLLKRLVSVSRLKSFGLCATCKYHGKNQQHAHFCELLNIPLKESDSELICREHSF